MDVRDLRKRTEISRPTLQEKTAPSRTEPAPLVAIEHAVILQFDQPANAPPENPPVKPEDNEQRSFKVGIVLPKKEFPSDPDPDPDTGAVPSAFQFLVNPDGKIRLFDVFCEPDMRAKHYAQWLWRGTLDSDAPTFVSAMRVLKVYPAYGLLWCEYASRIRYTRLLGGFTPSDCYINQVT